MILTLEDDQSIKTLDDSSQASEQNKQAESVDQTPVKISYRQPDTIINMEEEDRKYSDKIIQKYYPQELESEEEASEDWLLGWGEQQKIQYLSGIIDMAGFISSHTHPEELENIHLCIFIFDINYTCAKRVLQISRELLSARSHINNELNGASSCRVHLFNFSKTGTENALLSNSLVRSLADLRLVIKNTELHDEDMVHTILSEINSERLKYQFNNLTKCVSHPHVPYAVHKFTRLALHRHSIDSFKSRITIPYIAGLFDVSSEPELELELKISEERDRYIINKKSAAIKLKMPGDNFDYNLLVDVKDILGVGEVETVYNKIELDHFDKHKDITHVQYEFTIKSLGDIKHVYHSLKKYLSPKTKIQMKKVIEFLRCRDIFTCEKIQKQILDMKANS